MQQVPSGEAYFAKPSTEDLDARIRLHAVAIGRKVGLIQNEDFRTKELSVF